MTKTMFQVLKEVSRITKDIEDEQEKINFVKEALKGQEYKEMLGLFYNDTISWELPSGTPPYTGQEIFDAEGMLRGIILRGKISPFIKGWRPRNISQMRLEQLFIDMLESIHPEDAKLLVAAKDKQFPFKGLPKSLIKKVWPKMTENW